MSVIDSEGILFPLFIDIRPQCLNDLHFVYTFSQYLYPMTRFF